MGHTNAVTEPTKVQALSQSNINQISAGRTHTACWTSAMVNIEKSTRQLGNPDKVPDQFEALAHVGMGKLRTRIKVLQQLSDLVSNSWSLIDLNDITNNNNVCFSY